MGEIGNWRLHPSNYFGLAPFLSIRQLDSGSSGEHVHLQLNRLVSRKAFSPYKTSIKIETQEEIKSHFITLVDELPRFHSSTITRSAEDVITSRSRGVRLNE